MNVKDLTMEEIETRLNLIPIEMAAIEAQITKAKGVAAQDGKYSDPEWFSRARMALRLKGQQHQALQLEFGRRRREERRRNSAQSTITNERAFVNVAKRKLDPETYALWWSEAQLLMRGGGDGD